MNAAVITAVRWFARNPAAKVTFEGETTSPRKGLREIARVRREMDAPVAAIIVSYADGSSVTLPV